MQQAARAVHDLGKTILIVGSLFWRGSNYWGCDEGLFNIVLRYKVVWETWETYRSNHKNHVCGKLQALIVLYYNINHVKIDILKSSIEFDIKWNKENKCLYFSNNAHSHSISFPLFYEITDLHCSIKMRYTLHAQTSHTRPDTTPNWTLKKCRAAGFYTWYENRDYKFFQQNGTLEDPRFVKTTTWCSFAASCRGSSFNHHQKLRRTLGGNHTYEEIPLKFRLMYKQKRHLQTSAYNSYMILQVLGFLDLVPSQVMTKLLSVDARFNFFNVTSLYVVQSSEVRKTLAAPSCAAHQYSRYVAFMSLWIVYSSFGFSGVWSMVCIPPEDIFRVTSHSARFITFVFTIIFSCGTPGKQLSKLAKTTLPALNLPDVAKNTKIRQNEDACEQ